MFAELPTQEQLVVEGYVYGLVETERGVLPLEADLSRNQTPS